MQIKDIRFIQELDKNSRISLKKLGKLNGISKQGAYSKLKSLEEKKIFKCISVIDYFKMGCDNTHLYIKLQGLNNEKRTEKIEKIKKITGVTWIAEFFGDFDIGISIFHRSLNDLEKKLASVYKIIGRFINKKEIHHITEQFIPSFAFLESEKKELFHIKSGSSICKIDKTASKLLEIIGENARESYANLSTILKMSANTIKYHIKKLEKNKLIVGYKLFLDYNKLDQLWNLCILKLREGSESQPIINDLIKDNRVPFISKTIESDVLFDFICKDMNEFKEFINRITEKHQYLIKDFKICNVTSTAKIQFEPSG